MPLLKSAAASTSRYHDKPNPDDSSGSGDGLSSYDMASFVSTTPEIDVAWGRAETTTSPQKRVSSWLQRQVDSFKRDTTRKVSNRSNPLGALPAGGGHGTFDQEAAAQATAMSPLVRKLKGRHLQMIAIGGSIGTGLFVGSGKALSQGGPASLLIAFSLIGLMLYCTVHALGEMAVAFPVAGSFSAYSTRFLDPAWGFAMGWNYALQWLVVLPLETVSASITVGYWNSGISNAVWVTIFLVTIIGINLFGVRGYGEAEFIMGIVKVTAIIGFM